MPSLPVYSVTKAALQSFTISLQYTLAQTHIKVFEVLQPLLAIKMTENLPQIAKAMSKMNAQNVLYVQCKGVKNDRLVINITHQNHYTSAGDYSFNVQNQLNKMQLIVKL